MCPVRLVCVIRNRNRPILHYIVKYRMLSVEMLNWDIKINIIILSPITIIYLNSFSMFQWIFHFTSEDLDIRPFSTWERPINPYNITILNSKSNFISDSRSIELVWPPLGVKRWCLLYHTVSYIYSNKEIPSNITLESVIPDNL